MGSYVDGSGDIYGFLYDGAGYTKLNPPGSVFTNAYTVNDVGMAVGFYWKADGIYHGFLATPANGVPEPKTLFLFGLGLACMAALRRQKAKT